MPTAPSITSIKCTRCAAIASKPCGTWALAGKSRDSLQPTDGHCWLDPSRAERRQSVSLFDSPAGTAENSPLFFNGEEARSERHQSPEGAKESRSGRDGFLSSLTGLI